MSTDTEHRIAWGFFQAVTMVTVSLSAFLGVLCLLGPFFTPEKFDGLAMPATVISLGGSVLAWTILGATYAFTAWDSEEA